MSASSACIGTASPSAKTPGKSGLVRSIGTLHDSVSGSQGKSNQARSASKRSRVVCRTSDIICSRSVERWITWSICAICSRKRVCNRLACSALLRRVTSSKVPSKPITLAAASCSGTLLVINQASDPSGLVSFSSIPNSGESASMTRRSYSR